MTDAVLFDARDDGIAVITLNRPEARNALGKDIRAGLFAAWDRFERDPALRVAILTGSGDKAFCAGGDLKEMTELRLRFVCREHARAIRNHGGQGGPQLALGGAVDPYDTAADHDGDCPHRETDYGATRV
jgi:enoyl-CoA hydratase/carnithine racemase